MTIARPGKIEDRLSDERGVDLVARLSTIHDKIDGALAAYRQRVRRSVLDELATALHSAAETHAEVLQDAESEEAAGEQIRNYRASLHARVVIPLAVRLEEVDPGASITSAYIGLLDDFASVADTLEEEVRSPEPDALYAPSASDSLYRRARKMHVRTIRKVREAQARASNAIRRLARRPDSEIEPPHRLIRLRRLVEYDATVRVPLELETEHEELHRFVGEILADVGRIVTTHVHSVLEPPMRADTATSRKSQEEETPPMRANPATSQKSRKDEVQPLVEASTDETDGLHIRAERFEGTLRGLADKLASYQPLGRAAEAGQLRRDLLERDVFLSGTFMLDLERRDVGRGPVLRKRVVQRGAGWTEWHRNLCSRIVLMGRLLEFRESTIRFEKTLTARILAEAVRPVEEALARMSGTLKRQSGRAKKDFDRGADGDDIRLHLQKALKAVDNDAVTSLRQGEWGRKMKAICADLTADLSRSVEDLPEIVAVNVLEETDPEISPREVGIREQAARAYDALFVERIRDEIDLLDRAMITAQEEAAGVPGILQFNLGAALEDLEGLDNADARAGARELVVEGLGRSADVLESTRTKIAEGAALFRQRVSKIFETGFESLHGRLKVEERMREQMLDFRSEAEAGVRRVTLRASEEARRIGAMVRKAYRTGLRNTTAWIRLGTRAAGLATMTDDKRFATLDVLIDTERLLDNLPLVYRRIFSFDPVRDPALLEGRDREVRALQQHVERWQRGLTNALVLTGVHGSGHTSFLNVLRQTVLEDADVWTLDLTDRVRTEEELVKALRAALQLDQAPSETFNALSERLFAREETDRLPVCIIEHLEHVFLRQVRGTELAERFLTFLSRTDSRMVWIVTASDYGWQLIRNAEPAASRLVVVQSIPPVNRDELEQVILNRHRRSGLPLLFEQPMSEANPILARRLRRARSDEERQDILRTDYFDRLQRSSGRHISMALLHWLRSTEMDADEGVIRVQAVEPLSFAFLQKLDLDEAFTLKAILEHASLTVEEHSELFLLPTSTSLKHFESLGNLLLIEPTDKNLAPDRFAFSAIEEGMRYRIRPLLTNTIIQYLRSRNILH